MRKLLAISAICGVFALICFGQGMTQGGGGGGTTFIPSVDTNGLVTSSVTNGLVTSSVTNGLVTSSVTNGLVASSISRPSGAWYMAIGGVTGGNIQNETRDALTVSSIGAAGSAIQQQAAANGSSTLFQLPQIVAGRSVIFRGNFVTKAAETNQATANVACRIANAYITNINTFAETIPCDGDSSQGSVVSSIIVPVTNTQRQYRVVCTNAIPANATAITVQFARRSTSDTLTTNAYFWRLEWEMIP